MEFGEGDYGVDKLHNPLFPLAVFPVSYNQNVHHGLSHLQCFLAQWALFQFPFFITRSNNSLELNGSHLPMLAYMCVHASLPKMQLNMVQPLIQSHEYRFTKR